MANQIEISSDMKLDSASNSHFLDGQYIGNTETLPSNQQISVVKSEGNASSLLSEDTDKWILLESIKWESTRSVGSNLKMISGPGTMIKNNLWNTPLAIPLKNWAYIQTDVIFKIVVNANRFMVGQLQASFYYNFDLLGNQDSYNSIANSSQYPNVLISAFTNNSAEIRIPYHDVYTYNSLVDKLFKADYFTFFLKVLNPLSVPSRSFKSCNVSIFVRLENTNLHGMIYPQMFGINAIISGVEGLLKGVRKDLNCDNPSNPQVKPTIVPYGSHSWANGNNAVEELNILRLDPSVVTPALVKTDEMLISSVISKFGLVSQFKWNQSWDAGKVIKSFLVAPIIKDDSFYFKKSQSEALDTFVYPPVAVISSLFGYWRGSLEYRLDFISSFMHTGRVIVSYHPGTFRTFTPNLSRATSVYNVVFDLSDNKEFAFTIPYTAPTPFFPICDFNKENGSYEFQATGMVIIQVLNPLIPMDEIASEIEINLYQRAGSDFELAVPVNPMFGLGWDNLYLLSKEDKGYVKSGYNPVYGGSWRFFYNSKKIILRYGNVTDHIAQFENIKPKWLYKSSKTIQLKYQSINYAISYFASPVIPGDPHIYLIPFLNEKEGKAYINSDCNHDYAMDYSIDGDYQDLISISFDPYYTKTTKLTTLQFPNYEDSESSIEILSESEYPNMINNVPIEPENDTRTEAINLANMRPLDNSLAAKHFGETFTSLKDLCRRYQLYTETDLTIPKDSPYGSNICKIPLYPGGLRLNLSKFHGISKVQNCMRNGVIPIVASGYRYFRGGLRFKVLISCASKDLMVTIFHVPEIFSSNNFQTINPVLRDSKDFIASGYAGFGQSTKVNEIFEIEVPFYMNSDMGLLNFNNSTGEQKEYFRTFCLGYLAVSCLTRVKEDTPVTIQVYYSIADDMQFSSFNGFPRMVRSLDVPDLMNNVEPQMFSSLQGRVGDAVDLATDKVLDEVRNTTGNVNSRISEISQQVKNRIDETTDHINLTVTNTSAALQQKIVDTVDGFADKFDTVLPTIDDTMDVAKETMRKATQTLSHIDKVTSKFDEILKIVQNFFGDSNTTLKDVVISACSQLAHVLVNPTKSTIMVAIGSFLLQIGVIPVNSYKQMICWIGILLSTIIGCKAIGSVNSITKELRERRELITALKECGVPIELAQGSVVPESDSEPIAISFTSFLVGAISTILKIKPPKNTNALVGYTTEFLKNSKDFSMTANHMTIFLRNNMELFGKIFNWISNKIMPSMLFDRTLKDEQDLVKTWAERSMYLTDSVNRSRVYRDAALQKEVFEQSLIARALTIKQLEHPSKTDKSFQQVRYLTSKIIKLQEDLVIDCLSPSARYNPFCIYISGASNIGKSFISNNIGIKLLKSINYETYSDPIYTRSPGVQYWNSVNCQPIVYYDDFLALDGENANNQINELFMLKSPTIFNPPIAELENKKLRYNPLVVMIASNQTYPRVTGVTCTEAFLRRRDILVTARLKSLWTSIKEVPEDVLESYGHLLFDIHASSIHESMGLLREGLTYEAFNQYLQEKFLEYHKQELKNYYSRIQDLKALYPTDEAVSIEEYKANMNKRFSDLFQQEKDLVESTPGEYRSSMNILQQVMDFPVLPQANEEDIPLLERAGARVADHKRELDWIKKTSPHAATKDIERYFKKQAQPYFDNLYNQFEWMESEFKECEFCRIVRDNSTHTCLHLNFDFSLLYVRHQSAVYGHFVDPFDSGKVIPEFPCRTPDCWLRNKEQRKYFYDRYREHHPVMADSAAGLQIPAVFRPLADIYNKRKNIEFKPNEERLNISLESNDAYKWAKRVLTIGRVLSVLAGTAVLGGLSYGITKLISKAMPDNPNTITTTSTTPPAFPNSRDEYENPHGGAKHKNSKAHRIQKSLQAFKYAVPNTLYDPILVRSEEVDPEADSCDLINIIHRNTGYLALYLDNNLIVGSKTLGICGHFHYTTKHFWEGVMKFKDDPTANLRFIRLGKVTHIEIKSIKTSFHEKSALGIIKLPLTVQMCVDIRNHIFSLENHLTLKSSGDFVHIDENGREKIIPIKIDYHYDLDISGTEYCKPQYLPTVIEYSVSGKGLCVSPIIVNSTRPMIMALHVAGQVSGMGGYGELIARDNVAFLKSVNIADPLKNIDPQMKTFKPTVDLRDSPVEILGSISKRMVAIQPTKTRLTKTLIYNKLVKSDMVPSPLTEEYAPDGKNPIIHGVNKLIPPFGFDHAILDDCQRDLSEKIITTSFPVLADRQFDELTDDEIFSGISGNENYSHLTLNTSEGFPLLNERPQNAHDKSWLFEFEVDESGRKLKGFHKEFSQILEHNRNLRKQGIIPCTIFTDSLKDTKISIEKAKKPGGTRMFSVSPIEFTWACKQYFGHFQAAYKANRLKNETAIGINCDSLEWTHLANRLLAHHFDSQDCFISGDYKHFGDSLYRYCIFLAFQVIIEWYDHYYPENKNQEIRKLLAMEAIYALRLCGNVLYRAQCGIPSGFGLTVEINSLVNCLYMRYVYKIITRNTKYNNFSYFHRFIYLITYGDDILMSVSPDIRSLFNFQSVKKALSQVQIEFTSSQKGASEEFLFENFNDITFLKRKFFIHPFRVRTFIGPLPTMSVLEMLNWCWQHPDPILATVENVRSCIVNSYGQGPAFYNYWRKRLLLFLSKEFEIHLHAPTWEERDSEIFGENQNSNNKTDIQPQYFDRCWGFSYYDDLWDYKDKAEFTIKGVPYSEFTITEKTKLAATMAHISRGAIEVITDIALRRKQN